MNRRWVPHEQRDEVVDYVRQWAVKTGISQGQILKWMGVWSSTFSKWTRSYGKEYEHNGWIPRDHWLEEWEKQASIKFYFDNPLNGCRRLTYMMMDTNIVATSPASVYRVLSEASLLRRNNNKSSKKGHGFSQPIAPHQHWHVDIAYLNIRGTFYFITSVVDGFSGSVVHWEIREKMEETDIETVVQRAREKHAEAKPRIITDNGPQFVSKDFKQFVRICGMTHVRTSPYYPQSNGKIERYHRTLKSECIRVRTPLSVEDARRVVAFFVTEYNDVRLHSGIGYITPSDMMAGRQETIKKERKAKLEAARAMRAQYRQSERANRKARNSETFLPTAERDMGYDENTRAEDMAMLRSNQSADPMLLAGASVEATAIESVSHSCQ